MKKYILALVWLLSLTVALRAQQYPVQVNSQLLPPYSLQVSEYYSPTVAGAEKLRIMLLNRDLQRPVVTVRLRMIIESQALRLRTREDVTFPSLSLNSGAPYYVTPQDLTQYFNPNNLEFSGISREQYEQTGKLPEGLYSFCIEAVEIATGTVVSSKGCAYAWMTMSEPPMLNLPRKGESVTPNLPQNLIFNWTPRHTASPNAAFTTEYQFSIVEVNDPNINPEAAFLSQPVLFTDNVSTTTYLYDASKPQLIPGKKYAWRVRAVMKNGAEDLGAFRNGGISEVYWFTYQNTCQVPTGISATVQGQRVTIGWLPNPAHLEYKVEYREKNVANAAWFTVTNTATQAMIYDLKNSTQYEYRVGAACEYGLFNYSNLLTFTTNSSSSSNVEACGDTSQLTNPGQALLTTLLPGDSIYTGDFTVIVTQVSGSGNFTGEGYVKVPWLANMNLAVKFTSITLDLQKKLVQGVVQTSYDPSGAGIADIDEYVDAFTPGYGLGSVVTGADAAEHDIPFAIPMPGGITAAFGPGYNPTTGVGPVTITVTPSGGGSSTTITEDQLPTTIKDAGGNIYQVGKDGTVKSIGKSGGEQLLKTANKSHIDADKAIVKFVDYPEKQIYSFDAWQEAYKKSGTFNKEYERLNNDYYVPSKAIAPTVTDYLKAVVTIKDTTIKADSIKFVNGKGTIYASTKLSNGVYEIAVVGGPERDAQEIYAVYSKAGSKTLNLGKVLVASYPLLKKKLVLVPVAGGVVNKAAVEEKINSIYNKINVQWEVVQDTEFDYKGWDLDGNNKLSVNGSSFWSTLTDEMKLLNNAYRASRKVEEQTIYLFVLNQAAESTDNVQILGDMPRSRQFGYLFTATGDANLHAKTAAHELGHGVFNLKHVFEIGELTKGLITPANVMDYPSGDHFSKVQWNYIHDPALVVSFFEKDEAAQNQIVVIDKKFLNTDQTSVSFLAKNGTILSIPHAQLNSVEFSYGSVTAPNQDARAGLAYQFSTAEGLLHAFTLKNGNAYDKYKYDIASKTYKKDPGGQAYTNTVDFNGVDGFIFPMPCGDRYTLYKFAKGTITAYAAGAGSTLEFADLGNIFQPFILQLPVKINNEVVKQAVAGQVYESCLWCRDEVTVQMTASYCEKPELWYIDKAAQLRVIFPEYFKQFTQTDEHWANPVARTYVSPGSGMGYGSTSNTTPATNWAWGKYLADNPSVAALYNSTYDSDRRSYFSTFCYKLRDYIDTAIINSGQFWTNLSETTPVQDVVSHLYREPLFQTGKAPLAKRQLALKILTTGSVLEYKEDAVIKILSSVEVNDQSAMLSYLASDITMKKVFEKFDDFGGKDNFTKVVTLISSFITDTTINTEAIKLISDTLQAPRYISVDLDLWDNRQTDGYNITADNKVEFYNKVRTQIDGDDPRYGSTTQNQVFLTVPYSQMVPIKFWTDFDLGNGTRFRKGQIVPIPAIYAALLLHKSGAELFSKKAWLLVDGVMLVVGVGEVKILFSTASWLRKAMVVSNLASSTVGIINEIASDGAIPPEIKDRIRISCMLLQLPDAIRGISEVGGMLKRTSREAGEYADLRRGVSERAMERLNQIKNLIDGPADYIDDAAQLSRRVAALGSGDVKSVKQWLGAIGQSDSRFYVVAHSDGKNFSVITKTGEETVLNHRSLAKWIESKSPAANSDIVLLSCADLETAQNLSNKLNRKVIASDGTVSVHSDGGISSDAQFRELKPFQQAVEYTGQFLTPAANSSKVTLLSGWRKFINDLEDWDQSMKTALNADISASPELKVLFTNSGNKVELAEAWKLLKEADRTGGTNVANGLVRNPQAIEALARIRKNPNLAKYDLTPEILARAKAWGNSNVTDISFADVINLMDGFMTNAQKNNIEILNGKYLFARFVHDNPNDMQAVYWIMEDIVNDASTFKGSKIQIERIVENGRVDVFRHDPILYLEYKWYSGSNRIPKNVFLEEFVQRDLGNMVSIDNIQWRVKGNRLTKENVKEFLLSPEGKVALEKLPETKKASLFPGYQSEDELTDLHIKNFVEVNYSNIFK
ncbi:fibronectin type III domain-containing protein [Terrimonas sp. NA20]|uniref:Fibronectin type III domain-containing protein n=1 Tax=Terrimonas ginsenosidimutans TaxID=2908004 RepID=A0ABS9KZK2_9BACT|nr:fibronectin type III domain-containing protein [Terrimonas ginsenosidimutans]MCG2617748.1 fibronectin type III domain-containing protein [Terrimonas ginsenosidimutans]